MITIYKNNNVGVMYRNGQFYDFFKYSGLDKVEFDAIKHDIEFYESDVDLTKWQKDD